MQVAAINAFFHIFLITGLLEHQDTRVFERDVSCHISYPMYFKLDRNPGKR